VGGWRWVVGGGTAHSAVLKPGVLPRLYRNWNKYYYNWHMLCQISWWLTD